jgi:hypothetical protein
MRNYRNSKELIKFGKNAQKSTKVKDGLEKREQNQQPPDYWRWAEQEQDTISTYCGYGLFVF